MALVGRQELHEAYLLHRRNFRESSLLLDIFSREQGIVRLIAKGAMRAKGGKSGLLQPFLPLSLAWTARSEPALLTTAESRGNIFRLAEKSLFCGFYLNELLLRLLPPYDPHPGIFNFYEKSLERLEAVPDLGEGLRYFELALLEELGYGLLLDYDAISGEAIHPEYFYDYQIEQGPVRAVPSETAVRGSVLIGLRQGQLEADDLKESKHLMRRVIHHYLGGKPLRSRELFKYVNTAEFKNE